MTLEFTKIAAQIEEMGQALAGRASRQRQVLPAARALLSQFAQEREMLLLVAGDLGKRLGCASPGTEALDLAIGSPGVPQRVTLLAADGSQVYPDRHGLAFYYLINVGTLVFRHGSGEAPDARSAPRLYYTEEEVYPRGEPVSSDWVNAERALAELQALAELARLEPPDDPPRLALVDGSLVIWLERAAIPTERRTRLLQDYITCLDALRRGAVPVTGFVSRPHSAEVVALLYLAHLPPEERAGVAGLHETPFRGLTDRALFGFLNPGERSALFVRGTGANEAFRERGHAIHFFYLNTGTDVARVEIPEWVAGRREWLDLAHGCVMDQCSFNNGYPYVLTRADEEAVILGDEREVFESMLVRSMLRNGLAWPELSRKALQKQVARWRRR